MKRSILIILACQVAILSGIAAPDGKKNTKSLPNRGVLNGPLKGPVHKTDSQGTRESLKLAIQDLIATYGAKYPKGKDYLARLEKMKDEKSEAFLALKKEALLANPLLKFDKLLMVRSPKGRRYTSNWLTRTNCDAMQKKMSQKDLDNVLRSLRGDKSIGKLYGTYSKLKRTVDRQKKKITKSTAYRKAKKKDRAAILKNDPILSKNTPLLKKAQKVLQEAAMKNPKYKAAYEAKKAGKMITNYADELVVMSIRTGEIKTVYKPNPGKMVADVDLHFNGDRILFTSHVNPGELKKVPNTYQAKGFAVYEMKLDPKTGKKLSEPRRVTPDMGWDVDNYDACYLPDGRIIFASTAAYEGVPCVGGSSYVANLYLTDINGSKVRRLTFDQDASWHPSVMENGRIMYTRWEYTDSAHYFSRLLMTMNPDGTDQKAYYGSNSYWPNSIFFARQIPGSHTKFIATVTGHHDHAKGGALCLFDVSKGRHEADGALQLITARGKKVQPLVLDHLTNTAYYPRFFTPYPLSGKYFLAMINNSIYLADVYDNLLCLAKADNKGGLHEPIPLRKTKTPPAIPDRIDLKKKDATVMITDIYAGLGLEGVARGTVKGLRVYRYEYGPRRKGGHYSMGMEAGWDAKQILGTTVVEKDGSAAFKIPANTPFAMQPLDKDGKALAVMRSWTVAMPGEVLSCIGCHESQNMAPPMKRAAAMLRKPYALKPFYGPARGFSFTNEVQPVLQKHCIGCHDGSKDLDANGRDKKGRYTVPDRVIGTGANTGKKFAECGIPDFSDPAKAHAALHPYVRRNGPEGDYHLLTPLEFHAGTSELFQMLEKGHHGVKLDKPAYDRLVTWADLNAPFRGSWTEAKAQPAILARRMELRKLYAFDDFNPEQVAKVDYVPGEALMIPPSRGKVVAPQPAQVQKSSKTAQKIDLGDGIVLEFAAIPTGSFSMGSNDETPVEQPVTRVTIDKPFYMQTKEVSLEQYRAFDPHFLNGVYDMHYKDQVKRGYYMNDMKFPVIRVSWQKATEFCKWLSKKTGKKVKLPTEAQWEWACRAGTNTALSYGDVNAEFSKYANMADITVKKMAVRGVNPQPIKNPNPQYDFELKDPRSNDGVLHLAKVGSYQPNAWGLYDMHGNVAEWTRSDYKAYPYSDNDGRNAGSTTTKKAVRGGSWHDRPFRSTSSYRLGFPTWQRVYHVGFRVIIEQ